MTNSNSKIPDRWLDYTSVGQQIEGTPFIALKCPLNMNLLGRLPKEAYFSPNDVKRLLPDVGLIIDLTFTNRYYDKRSIICHGIMYEKIRCEGHVIPATSHIQRFFQIVDNFLSHQNLDKGKLIGVHCTHGVNRTGFFICSYMINKLGFDSRTAISKFNAARGHPIERINYIDYLKRYDSNRLSFDGCIRKNLLEPVKDQVIYDHRNMWRYPINPSSVRGRLNASTSYSYNQSYPKFTPSREQNTNWRHPHYSVRETNYVRARPRETNYVQPRETNYVRPKYTNDIRRKNEERAKNSSIDRRYWPNEYFR